jgi:hypothetical protein
MFIMKKLVFLFGMVFAVSMAIAQSNSSTVVQTGNSNDADVTQTGLSNTSTVTQTELPGSSTSAGITWGYNDADVTQDGDRNIADIKQDVKNTAEQTQTGDDNQAYIQQVKGNNGRDMWAYQVQTGDLNWARIDQGRNSSYGHQYKAFQTQIGNENDAELISRGAGQNPTPGFNPLTQYQEGSLNDAYMRVNGNTIVASQHQYGNENYAHTEVDGWYNVATIESNGIRNGLDSDPVKIVIDGESNNATILQGTLGDVNDNLASISLTGDDNVGKIEQESGDYNEARIIVGGSNNGTLIDPILIRQTGSYNFGSITANGDSNVGSIIQTGNQNEATVLQNP